MFASVLFCICFIVAGFAQAVNAENVDYLRVKDLTPILIHKPPQIKPMDIVRDGKPRAKIYVAETKQSQNLKIMIEELIDVIRLSTGAKLAVFDQMPAADEPTLVIGDCAASRKAGINAAKIPIEGFIIKTESNRVYLVGSNQMLPENENISDPYLNDGTAWAVADFLERFVGVRWYWPVEVGGRSIVKSKTLIVRPAFYSDQPVFRRRDFFPRRYKKPWARSVWYDKKSEIPASRAIPPEVKAIEMVPFFACLRSGNSWPYMIKVHQPQGFSRNPKKWEQHKAMFQKKKDGSPNYRMLDYTSQEAMDYLLKGCEDVWDKGKQIQAVPWVTTTSVTISPGDSPVECYEENCRKLYEPYKHPYGEASKIMGMFVKKFAMEVKRRWPKKKVLYLAYYNYTLCPEEIDFPDNLEIQMCTMAFALMKQPTQRDLMERSLRCWSKKVGGKILTWEYSHRVANWTYAPLQYPHLVQDYYRKNRDILAGSFLNGGDSLSEWSTTAFTLYCWMKVLWNPDVDIDAILHEYCKRMFPEAAGTMQKLIQLECGRWEETHWTQIQRDNGRLAPKVFAETWPPEVVEGMANLWKQARQKLKDDPVSLQRFEYTTWSFEYFLKEAKKEWAKANHWGIW
jgi:hypothetical protein